MPERGASAARSPFHFLSRRAGCMGASPLAGEAARPYGLRMSAAIRIVGIDPGLRRTGWGVIDVSGNDLRFVAAGSIAPPASAALAERLVVLHDKLSSIVRSF